MGAVFGEVSDGHCIVAESMHKEGLIFSFQEVENRQDEGYPARLQAGSERGTMRVLPNSQSYVCIRVCGTAGVFG